MEAVVTTYSGIVIVIFSSSEDLAEFLSLPHTLTHKRTHTYIYRNTHTRADTRIPFYCNLYPLFVGYPFQPDLFRSSYSFLFRGTEALNIIDPMKATGKYRYDFFSRHFRLYYYIIGVVKLVIFF